MRFHLLPSLVFGLAAVAPTFGQNSLAGRSDVHFIGAGYFGVQHELDAWRDAHGANWQVVFDDQVGYARYLYGGSAAPLFQPATDADWFALARNWIAQTKSLHGVDVSTLDEALVQFMPLSLAGSTDKVAVKFRQAKNGVPVVEGFADVLFDTAGRLLAIDTIGVRDVDALSTTPSISAQRASELAQSWFRADTGSSPTFVGAPKLVIDQSEQIKFRVPTLAWQLDVQFDDGQGSADGYIYRIDAHNGSQSSRVKSVHQFDVSGTVKSNATPGAFPDEASNPPVQLAMPYLAITSASGNATTDAAGNFNIVGASAPLNATFKFQNGTFATVNNNAGAAYTLTQTLNSASGNSVVMNNPAAGLVTAQANAFLWIAKQRDWIRGVNPADATADFLHVANANLAQTCNAFYNGTSTNYFQPGGGCVNTSYSSVVLHENGHWMNDLYSSGNGSDGFGEGNADNWSTYILDDPIVGHDFLGIGQNVRDANNTRQFCGDCCGGCYGEVHADGEVLMGACWKVRSRLKNTLGSSAGQQVANLIFLSWMESFNDTQIKTIVETHWLTLDDNDGNLNNGTPHFGDIDGGFKDQGFPGFPLTFVQVTNVTQVPSGTNPGPYTVNADVVALLNPPVSAVALKYRVNGGAFQSVAMSPTTGNTYSAQIPAQSCPTTVEYYVIGTDHGGQTGSFPTNAPTGLLKFIDANVVPIVTYDFESGTQGWTHGVASGVDEWNRSGNLGINITNGKAGDPTTAAVSGTNVFGTDLGVGAGANGDGFYSNNITNEWLRSPVINCSGKTGVALHFNRWLGVETGQFDHATVKVNGTIVWQNSATGNTIDTSWVPMDIDVSAIADNNASVQVEFGLTSDFSVTFGGWNVDDVRLTSLDCTASCPPPSNYCVSKQTSGGSFPAISFTGTPALSTNNFVLTLQNGTIGKSTLVFWGKAANNSPFFGGTLCVQPPIVRGPLTNTDGVGSASSPFPISPADVGTTFFYQWWMRDPADPFTVGLSNGLQAQICP